MSIDMLTGMGSVASAAFRRRSYVLAGIVTAGLAIAGTAVGALGSPDTTKQRPEAVLRAYVQATLSDHDDAAAAELTCRKPQLDSIHRWQRDLTDRRDRAALPPLLADVTSYQETGDDDMVTATTEVAVAMIIDGRAQERLTRPYTFTLTREQEWKVCTAHPNS